MNLFVFDIETIPDVEAGKMLYDLQDLSDEQVAEALFHKQLETNGSTFLPHHLHKIVAISVVLHHQGKVKVWSLGSPEEGEAELLKRFFYGIERYSPTLISWNGCGFDLPVIHYRSLVHGISAPAYWEIGDNNHQFKYNNYLSRFHQRHTDLMDVLAGYQNRAVAKLDQIATMLGFPGKMGMDGSQVWPQYQQGNLQAIRDYCETDVLNTYLVFLRFELIRGHLNRSEYDQFLNNLHEYLLSEEKEHLTQFAQNLKVPN